MKRDSLFGNRLPMKHARQFAGMLWTGLLVLGGVGPALAGPADPGRLFYTPAQRSQLEAARARATPQNSQGAQAVADETTPPLRYDGVVIRSDGRTTRWIDGKPQRDGAAAPGLKPGQVRADGKVYEPYEVLRPLPPTPGEKESAP